ncbi:MAG: ribosomal subunit interface protein [Rhizobiales bacterium 17-65-6]|nr:MAG: ribosomal subunit interface protein [Rhizobiales bacterium 12-68-15]OYX88803.1 MAG: ribosomal subunit interface protein [Xanthobacter sp. 35-67-6]OYX89079.1 MAG: ribosomal subunit interface protein [Azorhizobium sp. 32-67-21]OZA01354.1 MAG: ribosomal subunit interface protein [Rhizobiales bacterium 17-65-6]
MALRVSGKNIDVGEALRTRLSDRVSEVLSKYFDGGWTGHVTVSRDGSGYRSECLLHLDSGVNLQAHGNAHDANASADAAVDKVEKRLRRYKQRLKDRHGHGNGNGAVDAQSYVLEAVPDMETDEEISGWSPTVVAEQVTRLRQLSVADAVLELDITGAPVVVFRHAGHGRMSVVYRRPDGHVGWIDPAAFSEEKV